MLFDTRVSTLLAARSMVCRYFGLYSLVIGIVERIILCKWKWMIVLIFDSSIIIALFIFVTVFTVSVGVGGGRFRTIGDIRNGGGTGVFGSIGTRLSPNFALVGDYNGQSLSVGLPITIPFGGSALQVTPAIVDLGNDFETGGSRFVISGGLGFRF